MASYEKRGNKWRFSISITENGKRKKIQKGGFTTKTEARKVATEMESYYNKGFSLENNIIFHEHFLTWIKVNKQDSILPRSYARYEVMHKKIKEYFPYELLKDITKESYQEFLNDYAKTHSTDSVRKLNQAVRSIFDDAVHDGKVLKNPTYKATVKGKIQSKPNDLKFMELAEYEALKRHVEIKDTLSSKFIQLALVTGARFSEIQTLKTTDIDYENNTIHLHGTKTETSDRVISVDLKTMQSFKKFIDSRPIDINGYVFSHFGQLITNNAVNKALGRACKTLEFKNTYTIHSARHTHCSVLLSKGISIHYISKRLGHKNIKVTYSVYSHLLEDTYETENTQAMEYLESI